VSYIAAIGAATLAMLAAIGRIAIFAGQTASHLIRPPFYFKEFAQQLLQIGYLSLPVVGLTTLFTGGALALQIYAGGARFNAEAVVPTSSIAAEIATMKVTEQLDALVTLSTHPMKYLTVPRVLAALIVVPLLTGIGDVIGIMGGFLLATKTLGFNEAAYLQNTADFLQASDILSSLAKGAVFGVIAALMGCYYGMNSGRGAQGVGAATKASVQAAAILILAANFILTGVFFSA